MAELSLGRAVAPRAGQGPRAPVHQTTPSLFLARLKFRTCLLLGCDRETAAVPRGCHRRALGPAHKGPRPQTPEGGPGLLQPPWSLSLGCAQVALPGLPPLQKPGGRQVCGRRGHWDRMARGPSEGRRKEAGCTGRREGQGHCRGRWGPRGWRVGTRPQGARTEGCG